MGYCPIEGAGKAPRTVHLATPGGTPGRPPATRGILRSGQGKHGAGRSMTRELTACAATGG